MELILIKSYKHLGVYEKEWSAILEANENTNPFIEYMFVYNWWRLLGEGKEIEVYAVKENHKIIAFLPLQTNKRWLVHIYRFIAYSDANYMDIVAKKRDVDRVIMFVFDAIIKEKKHTVFYLNGLLESGEISRKLSKYLVARSMNEKEIRTVTPYIDLLSMSPQDILHLDQEENRLQEFGNIFLKIDSETELEILFDLDGKRVEMDKDTRELSCERKRRFLKFLTENNNSALDIYLSTLNLNDEIVAYSYAFSCRGRYVSYVRGYNADFFTYDPRRILFNNSLKELIAEGFSRFEMNSEYDESLNKSYTSLDFTRSSIFSSKTLQAKLFRQILWIKEFCLSKVNEKVHLKTVSPVNNNLFISKRRQYTLAKK